MNFRGLKDNGYGWAYGGLVQFEWGDFIVEFNSFEQRHRVIHESIGMQSPFKDNHGTPIYEGDLILQEFRLRPNLVCFGPFNAGQCSNNIPYNVFGWHIKFSDGGEYILRQDGEGYAIRSGRCVIIGNKHENKNLLSPEQLV